MILGVKKPKARERILNAANDLFSERGYSTIGINEIIARSETAKASFYHHFPSKENLCLTWLRGTYERSQAQHDAILRAPGNACDKVVDYFLSLKDWMVSKDFRGCPFTNTIFSMGKEAPSISDQVDRHRRSIQNFFVALAGEIVSSSAEAYQLGTSFFLLYSGATTEAQNLRAQWPIDAAVGSVRSLINRGEVATSL
jgi:AcrR family transcriptional regulator